MPRRAPRLTLAAACLTLAGCGRGGAPDRRSVVERAVALAPEVERAAGLDFTQPPRVEVRPREEVRAAAARGLDDPAERAELAGRALAYRRLGALPDSADLRALLARLAGDQVAGYYDPRAKTLLVVQGVDSAAVGAALRHELVHALQDQHRRVDSLRAIRGNADRALAARAALEGQATWAQLGGGADIASRAPGGWERARGVIRESADRGPEWGDAPLVVREGLLFPYLSGAELARAVALAGHPDSVLRRVPASSEQVLHAERYLARPGQPPDPPIAVTLPPPRAGEVAAENTMGEFDTRLVLYQQLEDLGRAAQAAAGWGGDRWQVLRLPAGEALVWLTVWDTPVDAGEFAEAMAEFVTKRYERARPAGPAGPAGPVGRARTGGAPADGGGRAFAVDNAPGGARALLVRPAEVGGRPAVLYVDAPAAAGTDLVDLARAAARPQP